MATIVDPMTRGEILMLLDRVVTDFINRSDETSKTSTPRIKGRKDNID